MRVVNVEFAKVGRSPPLGAKLFGGISFAVLFFCIAATFGVSGRLLPSSGLRSMTLKSVVFILFV